MRFRLTGSRYPLTFDLMLGDLNVGYVWWLPDLAQWFAYDLVGAKHVPPMKDKQKARRALIESVKASFVALGKKIEEDDNG